MVSSTINRPIAINKNCSMPVQSIRQADKGSISPTTPPKPERSCGPHSSTTHSFTPISFTLEKKRRNSTKANSVRLVYVIAHLCPARVLQHGNYPIYIMSITLVARAGCRGSAFRAQAAPPREEGLNLSAGSISSPTAWWASHTLSNSAIKTAGCAKELNLLAAWNRPSRD